VTNPKPPDDSRQKLTRAVFTLPAERLKTTSAATVECDDDEYDREKSREERESRELRESRDQPKSRTLPELLAAAG
jgi:hypothetical protein